MITRRRLLQLGSAGLAVAAARPLRAMSVSPVARPFYDARVMLIGESLAVQMDYTHMAATLVRELIAGSQNAGPFIIHSVEIVQNAAGGSVSCIENGGSGSNYWVNYNSGSPTDGPLLTAAVAELTARVPSGTTMKAFIVELGLNETPALAGAVFGLSAATALTQHNTSIAYMFDRLSAANGAPVPIYFTPAGRATGGGATAGFDALRKAQLSTVAGFPNAVRCPDIYDMGVFGNVHPERTWHAAYAKRIADTITWWEYAGSRLHFGPTITGMSQPTSVSVEVQVAAESGDMITKTASALGPCGFAFFDGTTPIEATFTGWSGNSPQWSFDSAPSMLKMSFPYGDMPDFDPARLIIGTTSQIPLASRYL